MDRSLYVKRDVRTWIERTVDVLLTFNLMGCKEFSEYFSCTYSAAIELTHVAANFIASIVGFDLVKLNAQAVIKGVCIQYHCSEEELIDALNKYIASQDDELWEVFSMTGAPSAEELIDFVLTGCIDKIAEEAERAKGINSMDNDFSDMLFAPVRQHWQDSLEKKCDFRLRLYDMYNRLVEETDYCTKKDAMELMNNRTLDYPEIYSRCVIMIRTFFAPDHDSVYSMSPGFFGTDFCRNADEAREWRAVFYDYTDRKIDSVDSKRYVTAEELTKYAQKIGAMCYVLLYRRPSDKNFAVQYFKVVSEPQNPDLLYAMEETVFKDSQ